METTGSANDQPKKERDGSEGLLKAAIEQAPIAIGLTRGKDFIFESINPLMREIIGKRSKEAVIGHRLVDLIPELEGQQILPILDRVLETGETFRGTEIPTTLIVDGLQQTRYFNVTYSRVLEEGKEPAIWHMVLDVTEGVLAKAKIAESESRFRNMIEQAPVAITLTQGEDMVIESINATMLKVMSKSPEEQLLGLKLTDVLPEVEGQPVLDNVLHVLHTGEPYKGIEVPVQMMTDGVLQTRYFDLSYTPIFDGGKVTSVLHVALDNTEQLGMRRGIEESEAKFRTMAESTPVLIAVGDEGGKITYFNRAWTTLTGRTLEELLLQEWPELLHEDDRAEFVNIFGSAFAHKVPFSGEFRVLNAADEYRWLHAHAVPRFDAAGNFMGYIAACTDVTDHKQSEEALETALEQIRLSKEAAELGTFDMDLVNGTLHWDERCRILFGISHHDPVTYERDFVGGLHPDDRERVLKVIEDAMTQSVSNGDYDVRYRTVGAEDGVIRWVRAKGKVYFNAQDQPVRFIGSVLDVTELVTSMHQTERLVVERTRELSLANHALTRMNQELSRSNSQLEEFAHAASHDLKEPVRKIQFFTGLLKRQLSAQLGDAQADTFKRIENATDRMGALIDDLLLYSHVSERPRERETVNLTEKVQHVLEILDLDIEEKRADVHVDSLPVVQGYGRQLQQAFQNLISNALKYSRTDVPPQIRLTADRTTQDGQEYYLITVADNGIGFEQDYADKIFQMFSRLHGKHQYSGTGVGLSIVKKVAENHGGFVRAESALGEGAKFYLYLPVG